MRIEELKSAPQKPGIYYFKNTKNGKYYIGQAEQLRKRMLHHVSNVKHERYDNPIYRAIKKYGWENFDWGILETYEDVEYDTLKKKMDEAEMKYIKEFNSYGSTGYNQTLGGDGGIKGYKFTDEQRKRISDSQKGRIYSTDKNKIFYYDIEKKEYGEYSSWINFRREHRIKSNHLDILLHGDKYIVSRTKEQLEEKIKQFESVLIDDNSKRRHSHNYNKTIELSEDKIEDIENGMGWKEYCEKYSVCKKTYFTHKNLVYPNRKREYETKVDLSVYECYRKEHSREDAMKHFNMTKDLTYRYDKRLREQGNAILTKDTTSSSMTDEMKNDILNNINPSEYCKKYKVSMTLYSLHKKIVKVVNSKE